MYDSPVKVSIIFPTYNGEKVINKCLESINNLNNLTKIELVIVDNNSKDKTKEIINSFKNIKTNLIKQEKNLGYARACNIGVINAKGEFIFITNQDVAFPKNFFEILLDLYKRFGDNKDFIICPAIVFPGKYINYFGAKIHFLGFSYTPEMYKKISEKNMTFKTLKASGCSMFMKKKTFIELNGFEPIFFMYHEDTDFSLKALRHNIPIYTTNETLLLHQKLHLLLNNFTYYYIERNRYICIYKNINSIKKLAPYIIITELMLLFQGILTNKLKLRLRIYKFFIQNYIHIKRIKFSKINSRKKRLKKISLDRHLDPIILGRVLGNVKILRFFLKVLNLII